MPRGAEQRGSGAPEVARERGGVRPPSVLFSTTTSNSIPTPQKIEDKTKEILRQDNPVVAFFEHDSCPLQITMDWGKTKTFAQIKESWEECSLTISIPEPW